MENLQPLVSIGIPIYNRPDEIRCALECMLAQTYANLEIIVSDNASPNPEVEKIAHDFAARDSRISYHRQPENMGGEFNFKFVFNQARGKYFMWAADDDQWAPDYVHVLLDALEKDPAAVGAFSPYQLIEDKTGNFFGNIWQADYQSRYAFFRLLKFTRYYDDKCIYGLMRREYLDGDNFLNLFKPWAWINAITPYNSAYPLLYFLLSKRNILLVGEKPLWFKSVTLSRGHPTPFMNKPLLGYFAHVVRKINLFMRAAHYIYLGSKSPLLVLLIAPFLLLRMLYDCVTPVYAALYIWSSGKKISDFSPHEIWRLGVR